MFSPRRKQHKVLNLVVQFIIVDMVNYFQGFQISTKMFLHNEPVFSDITSKRYMGMLRTKNESVSVVKIFSPFPVTMASSTSPGVVGALSILEYVGVAFYRTVFSFSAGHVFKFFATSFASVFHDVLQIKKAVFSGLKKTVKFQRLLTANKNLGIKKLLSSDKTIISYFNPVVNPGGM